MNFIVDYKRRFAEVVFDIILLFMSLFLAYNLRFEYSFNPYFVEQFTETVIAFIAIKIAVLFWQGMYRGDWKYMGIADVIILLKSAIISFLFIVAYVGLTYKFNNFSRAVLILDFSFSLILLGGIRIALRVMNEYIYQHRKDFVPVIVYGRDKDDLDLSLRRMKMKSQSNYRPVALYYDKVGEELEKGKLNLASTTDDPRPVQRHWMRPGKFLNESIQGVEVVDEEFQLYNILDKNKIKDILVLSNVDEGNAKTLSGLKKKGYKIIVDPVLQ
jgi:UDP-GlcNAc:undecaprenyl-phosphate GlcNAc-1-phosphate transferase